MGQCVSRVEGVVTAILGSDSGQAFWIQSPEPGDDDPRTSEGVLVTALEGLPKVDVGDLVRLEGRVEERSWGFELPVTRLVASGLETIDLQDTQDLPNPVAIGTAGVMIPQPDVASPRLASFDPDQFAADAFESMEGMLVRVERPVVVGPTSRYGELVVLPDAGQSDELRSERGGIRLLEDNINPQRIIIDDRLVAEPPLLKVGDTLAGPVEGVLHYSYGSYKLLNTERLPDPRDERTCRRTGKSDWRCSHLTVATFNVENMSVGSEEEKFEHLAGIVAGNLGAPDIVAVQEVQDDTGPEDDGTVTAVRTLERMVMAIERAEDRVTRSGSSIRK